MEPDPEAAAPPLVFVLWLIVLVLGFVLALSIAAPSE
jgi:hypothetical protein